MAGGVFQCGFSQPANFRDGQVFRDTPVITNSYACIKVSPQAALRFPGFYAELLSLL